MTKPVNHRIRVLFKRLKKRSVINLVDADYIEGFKAEAPAKASLLHKLVTFIIVIVVMLVTFGFQKACAQEFGGNPPSVKWMQVNTPQVKVIFPYGQDSVGRRVANIISQINKPTLNSIGYRDRQVSILLQNQTTISNAFVQLAPFRSVFYLMPQQNSFNLGSIGWADQLAVHEYRHIQQYTSFNVGFSKVLRTIFGEAGQGLGNVLSVPNWFFEGDAVYNETLVTNQGRGRLPEFFNGYRALWAADKNYSYMKLRNGSYRDFIPSHYELGYMLVAYGRQKYGDNFWRDVTHDAAAYHSPLYPFQFAFRKHAWISFKDYPQQALNSFKQTFNDKPQPDLKNKHFVANEEYPAYVDNNKLVYERTTYSKRTAFILKEGDLEKQIRVRDISQDNYFSYRNGKIVYAAYVPDLRWGYKNYSELRILDINSGAQRSLTKHTKYFSPDISMDGSKVVAVHVDSAGGTALHLISGVNGKLITVVPNRKDVFFTYPKFYNDNQVIAAIRKKDGGMALASVDLRTGKLEELTSTVNNPIGFLSIDGDTVYYTQTDVNDKLFAYNIADRKVYQFEGEALKKGIGNYQPTVSAGKLTFSTFTAVGYQLRQTALADLKSVNAGASQPLVDYGISKLDSGAAVNLLAKVENADLPVTRYKKTYNIFNFHSLIPDFNDPNYAVSLEGENVLGTMQTSATFNYNRDEGYKEVGVTAAYGGFFPVIRGGVSYTIDRNSYYSRTASNVYWNETQARIGASIPLTFTRGRHVTGLRFGSDVVYNNTRFQQAYRNLFNDRSYTYLNNYLSFNNRIIQPQQNIFPRWGQSFNIAYKRAVTNLSASQFGANGTLYLPGLGINHNLVLTGAFQQNQLNGVIRFSNNFSYSRGYTAENLYRLTKFGVNYHFPIAYPDAGFGYLIFLQRLRGNIFFDYTHAHDFYTNGRPFNANYRTVGAEVFFDTSWFNQVPLTFGLRFSRLLDDDFFGTNSRNQIQLIVPLTLF